MRGRTHCTRRQSQTFSIIYYTHYSFHSEFEPRIFTSGVYVLFFICFASKSLEFHSLVVLVFISFSSHFAFRPFLLLIFPELRQTCKINKSIHPDCFHMTKISASSFKRKSCFFQTTTDSFKQFLFSFHLLFIVLKANVLFPPFDAREMSSLHEHP